MDTKKILIPIIAVAGLLGLVFYFAWKEKAPDPMDNITVDMDTPARLMSIETYVTQNISELSPIKEQVGGTFYVTKIEAKNGSGVVEYEDGHNAYVADFTYKTDEEKGYTILSFTTR